MARCTVARLMKKMALQGVIRGGRVRTTVSDRATPCPLDHVNRQFSVDRPNVLWVSDFTYVATWQGFVYVAFVIDAYARRIVGWRVSRSAHAGFVLDALEQALHDRRPVSGGGLVHHSDRGVQYVSIKYTQRLAEAGLVPSVGSVGDSYDNALAETINGLYKAEVILGAGRGARWRWSSSPRSNGSTGSTTAGSCRRSATSRRPRRKPPTMRVWRNPPHSQPDSNETASEKPGTVHVLASQEFRQLPEVLQATN